MYIVTFCLYMYVYTCIFPIPPLTLIDDAFITFTTACRVKAFYSLLFFYCSFENEFSIFE